ncbi:uncharacterized protein LOC125531464 isoform X2 [Triticum urartu]|uniref:uncharacterized protein LOC125531464 isoform X2 n=1 Tax=Triticum urartu TaxID=4572 RepID=UPI002042CCCC|nr:uncharacterized protein LOC125531464 isoform X2 [Triticum urartu]
MKIPFLDHIQLLALPLTSMVTPMMILALLLILKHRSKEEVEPKEMQRRITAACIRLAQGVSGWFKVYPAGSRDVQGGLLALRISRTDATLRGQGPAGCSVAWPPCSGDLVYGCHAAGGNNPRWRWRWCDVLMQCREVGVQDTVLVGGIEDKGDWI